MLRSIYITRILHMTSRNFVILAGILCLFGAAFNILVLTQQNDAVLAAALKMWLGLLVGWIIISGILMHRYREIIVPWIRRLPGGWQMQFVLSATILALIEEAITTTLTNLAPAFGVPLGAAYITASSNYFDVIFFHSVIVFIPMFIAWSWLLSRYDFKPTQVFLLFGLLGTIAEAGLGGPQAVIQMGFWIFVYGLMVYLPAYALPTRPKIRKPSFWEYLLAIVVPYIVAIPVAVVVNLLHPIRMHF